MTNPLPARAPKISVSCRAAIKADGRTACRSSCTKATLLSGICLPTAIRSWMCAIRFIRRRLHSWPRRKTPARIICKFTATSCLQSMERNIWAMKEYVSEADYYAKSLIDLVQTEQPFAAGLRIFDVSNPAAPREISFLAMPGFGAHRIWWVGGADQRRRLAHLEGFIDHILAVIDVSNPEKPSIAGQWWLHGMHRAGGETAPASFGKRTALHHLISAGNIGDARRPRRLHDLRFERSTASEIAQPSQLCTSLWRRRAYATAAARPQATGARGRGRCRPIAPMGSPTPG